MSAEPAASPKLYLPMNRVLDEYVLRIPHPQDAWLLPLLGAVLLLGLWIWRRAAQPTRQQALRLYLALGLKVLAAAGLGLVYNYHYRSGDTLVYHTASRQLVELFRADPATAWDILQEAAGQLLGQRPHQSAVPPAVREQYNGLRAFQYSPRALAFVSLLAPLSALGLTTYLSQALALAVLNTLLLWLLYQSLLGAYRVAPPSPTAWWLWAAVFLTPSVWVWSSGLLRESLYLGGFALVLAAGPLLGRSSARLQFVGAAALVLGALLAVLLSPWLLLAASPFLLVWWAGTWMQRRWPRWRARLGRTGAAALLLAVLLLTAGLAAVVVGAASPNRLSLWDYMHSYRAFSLERSHLHSHQHLSQAPLLSPPPPASPDLTADSTAPQPPPACRRLGQGLQALGAAYTQPWPGQVNSWLAGGMLLENLLLGALLLWGIGRLAYQRRRPRWRDWGFWAACGFAVFYGLFLGLSVPFLGSLMRYRAGPLLWAAPLAVLFLLRPARGTAACERKTEIKKGRG